MKLYIYIFIKYNYSFICWNNFQESLIKNLYFYIITTEYNLSSRNLKKKNKSLNKFACKYMCTSNMYIPLYVKYGMCSMHDAPIISTSI